MGDNGGPALYVIFYLCEELWLVMQQRQVLYIKVQKMNWRGQVVERIFLENRSLLLKSAII